jgi:DNA replication licensing factor MCM7
LEGLNLNGGDSDEYDMVDDAGDPAPDGTQRRNKSEVKYMQMLQDVADRVRTDVLIDLNDLEDVST